MYEWSFSTRFSDLLISTDSFVCAESVSTGVGLRSAFSVSIDPLQLIMAKPKIQANGPEIVFAIKPDHKIQCAKAQVWSTNSTTTHRPFKEPSNFPTPSQK